MNVFIDCDGVMWRSVERLTEMLNEKYGMNVDWRTVQLWNLTDKFPTNNKEVESLFNEVFFNRIYFMPEFKNVLSKIKLLGHNAIAVTIGNHINLSEKMRVISEIPEISTTLCINFKDIKMDKSLINMGYSIFIDDSIRNINSSNARIKILFADEGIPTEWNRYLKDLPHNVLVAKDWCEVQEIIEMFTVRGE